MNGINLSRLVNCGGGIKRIIKDNGAIILFSSGMFTADLMESNRKMWRYNLVYEKTLASGFLNAKRMPLRAHEDICIFYKALPTYNPQKVKAKTVRRCAAPSQRSKCYGDFTPIPYESDERYPRSVWKFANEHKGNHQTAKPIKLIEELIKTYSNPGEIVLDLCAGSMTTAIAAANTGRHYICFEKDPDIYARGVERFKQECCM